MPPLANSRFLQEVSLYRGHFLALILGVVINGRKFSKRKHTSFHLWTLQRGPIFNKWRLLWHIYTQAMFRTFSSKNIYIS